jgi:hypothetical protein
MSRTDDMYRKCAERTNVMRGSDAIRASTVDRMPELESASAIVKGPFAC